MPVPPAEVWLGAFLEAAFSLFFMLNGVFACYGHVNSDSVRPAPSSKTPRISRPQAGSGMSGHSERNCLVLYVRNE